MLEYRIAPVHPEAREYALELTVPAPDPTGQRFAMAAWTPGSYMVRDHARHVTHIEARDAEGGVVPLTWVDKQTWRAAPCEGPLTLRWRVHAYELSVRTAYLDTLWGFADGAALWLRPLGLERAPCRVELQRSQSPCAQGWRAAVMLLPEAVDDEGYGTYLAEDFEALLDAPVAFGPLRALEFEVRGVPHRFAWLGRAAFDEARLASDLARACEAVVGLFGAEPPPFPRYLFLALVTGDGYGGLEHREGTALLCRREHFPLPGEAGATPAYREFLGLCAHEYLHAWLVKRIRPAALMGLPLDAEAYTRLLWLFEGVTSYYDDLLLARAGLITPQDYLDTFAATLSRVRRAPGRLRQSLEHASLTAWTRLYKADENTANVGISYYTKGALFAWVLDAELRRRSRDRVSLDELLRALWHEHGLAGRGVSEDELEAWLQVRAGVELADLFEAGLRGTAELPLEQVATTLGLRLIWGAERETPWLGAEVRAGAQGEAVLGTVYAGAAAERAGLAPRDVLVAIDGLRVDAAGLEGALRRLRIGQEVRVHAFRRDELLEVLLCLDPPPMTRATLAFDPQAEGEAARRRAQWLGVG
ncbi:PDZ domain-containing protein [Thiofaba sp. EF100]|uniref:M61 family metallopeptidase n=1 Tax=Thiofaba sp. EF100 TaxID=3121274 RepID=UPI003221DCDB